MDITYNKVDETALPISQNRLSASEYNQIAASLMHIINTSGLTPDSQDNAQLLNALGPRIVETYSNGTSWYRVWSDGWCEQGGISVLTTTVGVSISFLKTFSNTDYTAIVNIQTTNSTGYGTNVAQSASISYTDKSTSSMGIYTAGITNFNVNGLCWLVCGYIS